MTEQTLYLSVMDQNTSRCYSQVLLCFPFPDDSQMDAAIEALTDGLNVTVMQHSFSAGTIGPADPETGRYSLTYPTQGLDIYKTGLFAVKRLAYPSGFSKSYAQLKAEGMPLNALTGRIFCPDVLRDRPGIPVFAEGLLNCKHKVPVMAIQAFFITGGLVLSFYAHHSAMDCAGLNMFLNTLAENVCNRRSLQTLPVIDVPDQSSVRKQLDDRIPSFEQPPRADLYTRDKFRYQKTLSESSSCSSKLFIIPADRIHTFREELQKSVKDGTKLTICNVLAALVWTHITRARAGHLLQYGYMDTKAGVAVDTRGRLDPPLPVEYMGSMAMFTKAVLSVCDFVAEKHVTIKTLLPVALEINRAIATVDNAWVERHLAFFKSKIPIKDTEPALRFKFGPDIYITSWLNFAADHKWNIPGTTSENPEFIRRPKPTNSDGGIIILPRSRDVVDEKVKPYEVLVRLAKEDMERVEKEEGGLSSWAERVVE